MSVSSVGICFFGYKLFLLYLPRASGISKNPIQALCPWDMFCLTQEQGRPVAPCVQMCLRQWESEGALPCPLLSPDQVMLPLFPVPRSELAPTRNKLMVTCNTVVSSAARVALSLVQHAFHFQKVQAWLVRREAATPTETVPTPLPAQQSPPR